jgi:hypothetical protein
MGCRSGQSYSQGSRDRVLKGEGWRHAGAASLAQLRGEYRLHLQGLDQA